MSDDLVKRLRAVSLDFGVPGTTTLDSAVIKQAADRLEALTAEVARLIDELSVLAQRAQRAEKHEKLLSQLLDAARGSTPKDAGNIYKLMSFKEPQFVGHWQLLESIVGEAIDDLVDVMEWLRESKKFAEADRLRTIIGRLARGRVRFGEDDTQYRQLAKTYENQLTPKESRQILKERDEAIARAKAAEAKLAQIADEAAKASKA